MIFKNQFVLNDMDVSFRIDRTLYMDNIRIIKAAHDVENKVYFPDMGEKRIALPLPFGSPFDQPGNIHKFDRRRQCGFWSDQTGKLFKPLIRDRHQTDRKSTRLNTSHVAI